MSGRPTQDEKACAVVKCRACGQGQNEKEENSMNLILASGSPRRKELLSYTRRISPSASAISTRTESLHPLRPSWWKSWPGASASLWQKTIPARWCWDVTPSWMWAAKSSASPQRGGRKADAPRPVRRDPRGAYRRLRVGRRTHRELRGQLQGDLLPIPEGEIDAYTATKEPYDKAGAYAIQGRAALWLDQLEGDYYTIMGLPVSRTARLLNRF